MMRQHVSMFLFARSRSEIQGPGAETPRFPLFSMFVYVSPPRQRKSELTTLRLHLGGRADEAVSLVPKPNPKSPIENPKSADGNIQATQVRIAGSQVAT